MRSHIQAPQARPRIQRFGATLTLVLIALAVSMALSPSTADARPWSCRSECFFECDDEYEIDVLFCYSWALTQHELDMCLTSAEAKYELCMFTCQCTCEPMPV